MEKVQEEIEDKGENRTVFSATHEAIRATGKTMCTDHSWKKLSENELYCTSCPTVIICAIDDERLLAK